MAATGFFLAMKSSTIDKPTSEAWAEAFHRLSKRDPFPSDRAADVGVLHAPDAEGTSGDGKSSRLLHPHLAGIVEAYFKLIARRGDYFRQPLGAPDLVDTAIRTQQDLNIRWLVEKL